jgi:hypothetical protein
MAVLESVEKVKPLESSGATTNLLSGHHKKSTWRNRMPKCRPSRCVNWSRARRCPGFPARRATGAAATRRDATDCPFAQAAGRRTRPARTTRSPGAEVHAAAECRHTTERTAVHTTERTAVHTTERTAVHTTERTAVHIVGKRRLLHNLQKRTLENPLPSQRCWIRRDRRVTCPARIVEPQACQDCSGGTRPSPPSEQSVAGRPRAPRRARIRAARNPMVRRSPPMLPVSWASWLIRPPRGPAFSRPALHLQRGVNPQE